MTVRPRGFVPFRHLGGQVSFQTRRYEVSAGNPTRIMPGDPVRMLADGQIQRVRTSAVTVAELAVLGVVARCYNVNGRPLTFSQPDTGPTLNASTAGFVDVYDDPDMTFIVNTTGTVSVAQRGMFARVTAATANTAAGISGFKLAVEDTTASAVGHQYQILGPAPEHRIGLVTETGFDASTMDVEVRIADHLFNRRRVRIAAGIAT